MLLLPSYCRAVPDGFFNPFSPFGPFPFPMAPFPLNGMPRLGWSGDVTTVVHRCASGFFMDVGKSGTVVEASPAPIVIGDRGYHGPRYRIATLALPTVAIEKGTLLWSRCAAISPTGGRAAQISAAKTKR